MRPQCLDLSKLSYIAQFTTHTAVDVRYSLPYYRNSGSPCLVLVRCVTARGYSYKDIDFVVRLCSAASHRGAEVAGGRPRPIGESTGEADETVCAAPLENYTAFSGFLLICNNWGCAGGPRKA